MGEKDGLGETAEGFITEAFPSVFFFFSHFGRFTINIVLLKHAGKLSLGTGTLKQYTSRTVLSNTTWGQ